MYVVGHGQSLTFGRCRRSRELTGLHAVIQSQCSEVEERRQDAIDAVVEEIVELALSRHAEANESDFYLVFFQRDIVAVEVATMINIFSFWVDDGIIAGRIELILKDLTRIFQRVVDGTEDLRCATQ